MVCESHDMRIVALDNLSIRSPHVSSTLNMIRATRPGQRAGQITAFFMGNTKIGTEKTMTARDMTGFCASFSARKSGHFLHIWGEFLTEVHSAPGKKGTNIHCREFKKSNGDGAPKLQISLPCRGQTCPDKKNISCQLGSADVPPS